jgi:hypothetical protein
MESPFGLKIGRELPICKPPGVGASLNQDSKWEIPNQISSRQFVSPFCTAIIYLGLGDKERALDGLEKAYEARSQWLTLLKVDKVYDPFRSDPRFIELLKKVGLNN